MADRLWEAHQNDQIPYIERLADYWGGVVRVPRARFFLGGPADRHGRDGVGHE